MRTWPRNPNRPSHLIEKAVKYWTDRSGDSNGGRAGIPDYRPAQGLPGGRGDGKLHGRGQASATRRVRDQLRDRRPRTATGRHAVRPGGGWDARAYGGVGALGKARVVAVGVDDLRASVRSLLGGVEAEITAVVDVMLPSARLVDAVQAFEAMFPTVKLRLHLEALSAVAQVVRNGMAMVGVGGGVLATEPDLEPIHVGNVEMTPVAAPHPPLALARPVPAGAARRHRQLILTVRTPFSEGPDVGVFAADGWRLADLGAKHALLLAGVGWGNMPEPNIRGDLAAGRLVRLELPEARSGAYSFQAMYRTDTPPGPAAAWLIQRFADQTG